MFEHLELPSKPLNSTMIENLYLLDKALDHNDYTWRTSAEIFNSLPDELKTKFCDSKYLGFILKYINIERNPTDKGIEYRFSPPIPPKPPKPPEPKPEDDLLASLLKLIESQKEPTWRTVSNLWARLELLSADPISFRKTYRDAVNLGKQLWGYQDRFSDRISMEWRFNSSKGSREWMIKRKD